MSQDKERMKRVLEVIDARKSIDTDFCRRLLRRVLVKCRVFGSVVQHSTDQAVNQVIAPEHRIWYLAGQQDLGHWLMEELGMANPQAFMLMNQEAFDRKKAETETQKKPEEANPS